MIESAPSKDNESRGNILQKMAMRKQKHDNNMLTKSGSGKFVSSTTSSKERMKLSFQN